MKATVMCIGKHEFTRKDGKTAYVLELVDFDNELVYRAFTNKKHFDKVEKDGNFDGYLTFENGFTKFYLPKDEVQ